VSNHSNLPDIVSKVLSQEMQKIFVNKDLESLIKHSCSHGLFLLIAKARLTDCSINRNFPVSEKIRQVTESIFKYVTLFSLF